MLKFGSMRSCLPFVSSPADGDFYELSITMGAPPKVVWLKGCDYPTSVAAQLIRDQAIRITEFLQDSERAVLILTP
ncbi:MAG: hypothetical protein QOI94_3388 [Acidobacteriaceae bacterium]|jgi:predicted nuclease of predicted toxin-antitoxin system|nr:hypothetical protein [Acidobacteriaceae bacterium]